MIRRLIARLLPGRGSTTPRIYGPDAHPVRRSQISRGAQDVTRKLQQAGFKAFVVGGAVRDLLLGIAPKDFDIATDATPEQVKPLFRRAFIIGRRFRLVNVLAGPETIEVSTFRARADRRRRIRRARPPVVRQRLRLAGGRRAAPRLHLQRPVLRPGERGSLGLRRRRARRPGSAHAPDRRPRHALSRRPRPHAARRAPRGEARPHDREKDRGADTETGTAAAERSAGAPVRRNGEAPAVRPRAGIGEEPARARPAPRRAAAARRDRRTAAGPALHRVGAGQHRCARTRGASVTPAFLFATLLWHEVLASWTAARAAAEVDARVVRGDGQGAGTAGQEASRFRAASKPRSRRSGRCSRASSSARDNGLSACSSIRVFVPDSISCDCAATVAKWKASSRTSPIGGKVFSTPNKPMSATAMLRPDDAPKKKRRPRSRGRKRPAGENPGGAANEPATSSGDS